MQIGKIGHLLGHTHSKTFETGGNESQTSKTMGNEKVRLKQGLARRYGRITQFSD